MGVVLKSPRPTTNDPLDPFLSSAHLTISIILPARSRIRLCPNWEPVFIARVRLRHGCVYGAVVVELEIINCPKLMLPFQS